MGAMKDRFHVQAEACAEANAHLNNVGLPNVHALVSLLAALTRKAEVCMPEHDETLVCTRLALSRFPQGVTGGCV